MQQKPLSAYRPNYPKKLLKTAALTAAALVAIGSAACEPALAGVPMPAETSLPTEEPEPDLLGEPTVDVGGQTGTHLRGDALMTEGKLVVDEPQP